MKLVRNIFEKSRILFGFFLDLIFPKFCLGCNQIDTWLCSDCLISKLDLQLREIKLDICESVDKFFYVADFDNDLVAKIVKTCKYKGVRELAKYMGKKLAEQAAGLLQVNKGVIFPVPLHKVKLRTRGFNQAEIMAMELGKISNNLPIKHLIVRRINTGAQAKLGRVERLSNLARAFCLKDGEVCREIDLVIIVDDVITTGSTINEIARILKQAGVRRVWGLAFAHGK